MVVKPKQRANALEQVVVAPTSVQLKTVRSAKPAIRSLPDGDVIISHREYFTDVNSTSEFTAVKFNINPGRSTMFPWLSGIAMNYERYRFTSLKFHFRTGAPTSTPGKLGMYADYDASDPVPTTKAVAFANRNYVDSPIWANCTWTAAASDLRRLPSYYVYDGNTTETDHALDLSDLGILVLVTSMDSSPNLSGELFVEYTVQLMTPSPRSALTVVQRDETEDVFFSPAENPADALPFGPTADAFNSGISPLSDTLFTWASDTAIQFSEDFYGTLSIVFQGTGFTPGITWFNMTAGAGTTVSNFGSVVQSISADQTTLTLTYVLTALTGQYLTVYDLFSYGAIAFVSIIGQRSKPGAHERPN